MSIETLLTLVVAGILLVLAVLVRLVALLTTRWIRVSSGDQPRYRRRPFSEEVARRSLGERIKPLFDGIGALVLFVTASIADGFKRRTGVSSGGRS